MRATRWLLGAGALALALGLGLLLSGRGGPDRPRLTVYTAHSSEIVDALIPRFEQEAGVSVDVVKMGSGDVMRRIQAERSAPRCDVVWSVAGEVLQANGDALDPWRPPEAEALDPAWQRGASWTPYTGMVVCLVVNTDLVPPGARPRGWEDLTRPDLKGKVVTARADKSGSAYMQLCAILAALGERGWAVYRDILANCVLAPTSSAVLRLVNDGEAAVGIALEDNALRYVRGGGPVEIVYPAEGTAVAPDGLALVAGAPQPELAKRFISWALSPQVQAVLVAEMGRRPVRRDGQLPPDLPPLERIRLVPYDLLEAASAKDERLGRWNQLVSELQR